MGKTPQAALTPPPLCILVRGHDGNRRGADARLGVDVGDRLCMAPADAALKASREATSATLYALRRGRTAKAELYAAAIMEAPPAAAVLVLEALIVLLTPGQKYGGPNPDAVGASWAAARRLLLLDPTDLADRLGAVDAHAVPEGNRAALLEYLAHKDWPPAGARVAGSRAFGLLAAFAASTSSFAEALAREGGPPPPIEKSGGVFSSVVACRDGAIAGDTGEDAGSAALAVVPPEEEALVTVAAAAGASRAYERPNNAIVALARTLRTEGVAKLAESAAAARSDEAAALDAMEATRASDPGARRACARLRAWRSRARPHRRRRRRRRR